VGTARREAPLAPFRGARVAAGAQARDDASVALLSLPMLLLACAAWRPDAPGRFDLVVPQGWEITHNRSIFGPDSELGDEMIELGAAAWIGKPFDDLHGAIKGMLAQHPKREE
jgi:hypothetical protein